MQVLSHTPLNCSALEGLMWTCSAKPHIQRHLSKSPVSNRHRTRQPLTCSANPTTCSANRDIQRQLDTAYGQGKPRAGAVAEQAFDEYDRTNQCWPWKAATQNKAHWLQGRQDGSLSPFVPFEKQD